jgi:hypothetical protein
MIAVFQLTACTNLINLSPAHPTRTPPEKLNSLVIQGELNMKRSLRHRSVVTAIISLVLLLLSSPLAFSQRGSSASNKELPLREILKMSGKVISEARTAAQSGDLKLTGYRVEEVQLPRSIATEVRGEQVTVNRAWRVTINGGPFPVRALPAVIWIDDQIAGYGIENETLSQITAVTFDESLIHNGGAISLSYGENKEGRVRLSQRLQLKREGENQ